MSKKLPLSGIKVLDLSHLLPGPLCTLMLADLGAEVLKIEKPPYGDLNRRIPPFHEGFSTYFMMLNRNKKSLCLDLKTLQGKNHFIKLVKQSDIIVENFRPGVMKRLGLDYSKLSKINPKLIYCAISGYGQRGPMKEHAGHDLNYVALSGMLAPMAFSNQKPPMLPTQLSDIVGGSFLPAISILSALEYRRKNKKGLFIDSAMTPATLVLLMMVMGKYLVTGEEMHQKEDRMTGKYPNYALYETKDKKAMAVAAIEPKFWKNFCKLIQKEAYASWAPLTDEPGFPTPSLANVSNEELKKMREAIQAVFKAKTQKEWVEIFKNEPDACCTPVYGFKDAVEFLQWTGRRELIYLKDKKRKMPQLLFPWGNPKLSRKKHSFPPELSSF